VDFKRRMNRELWEFYEGAPILPPLLDNLADFRQRAWSMTVDPSSLRSVAIRDQKIPGLRGGPDVKVRIYSPQRGRGDAPALVWIHGGGFLIGNLDQDDHTCVRMAEKVGCVVVSVEYRLAPEYPFPAGTEDCYAALLWIGTSAVELEIDVSRIAVGGMSAGGGIAAGVAIMARDRGEINLAYQLLLCPCLDDRHITQSSHEITDNRAWSRAQSTAAWSAYLGGAAPGMVSPYAAPARLQDCSGLPPTYLAVGELDLMRDEIIDYAGRLICTGVTTELHVWPGAFHGFEVMVPDAAISRAAVADHIGALQRVFAS
jgi:acetyl esterase/lipase